MPNLKEVCSALCASSSSVLMSRDFGNAAINTPREAINRDPLLIHQRGMDLDF